MKQWFCASNVQALAKSCYCHLCCPSLQAFYTIHLIHPHNTKTFITIEWGGTGGVAWPGDSTGHRWAAVAQPGQLCHAGGASGL